MEKRARLSILTVLLICLCVPQMAAADARFDLVGPKIDVRVTRTSADGTVQTLPIASVPNLQPKDKLWIHPDLPPTQSVKYLLICVFLRGNTNPPPEGWFTRIETWNPKIRAEGTFVTVPEEAQQALLFMAPETGGDFSTLRSAVQGRPGAFVRASQDLTEAGFEQARIEKYIASIRRVPPSDPAELQRHSDLLARTLALKPNTDCFKRPVDTQFTCLTQTGTQVLLDDGHGQTIVTALSNGPGSDFIQQASYTNVAGGGLYSAYVGAIVDLVRIMGNLHTAQYQYIPAISFPQAESMNLRLNTPPSFHNPKSVLVIALPSVQAAKPPPLRPADANHVACLLEPSVALPIEGAPLVFSADFAHNLVLRLNTPPGAPAEPDIPLVADAYAGGLVLQRTPEHHVPLRDPKLLPSASDKPSPLDKPSPFARPDLAKQDQAKHDAATEADPPPQPEPVMLTGTILGQWGFDNFTGPTVPLQQLPGKDWTIVTPAEAAGSPAGFDLIAGRTAKLLLTSTGTACVHTVTARPTGRSSDLNLTFAPELHPDQPNRLAVTLPQDTNFRPGDLHLAIQQFDQPKADEISTRTFAEPAQITEIEFHSGDRSLVLKGSRLNEVSKLALGDLVFSPPSSTEDRSATSAQLVLAPTIPNPSTHPGDHLTARITLEDGRSISAPVVVAAPRPSISLIGKSSEPAAGNNITLTNPDDLPLSAHLTFTLKSANPFPRNGQVVIETVDGTLRSVLTLAPSGGLVLQDPHTIVATLDPLSSFGPSAFGVLRARAVFPNQAAPAKVTPTPEEEVAAPASDWLPLVTLVRLPILGQLQCASDTAPTCSLSGSNLFLLQAVSTDPAFADPVAVPDGYTGSTLNVPRPAASTLFLKLRDDPSAIDSANLPATSAAVTTAHVHTAHKPATPAPSTPTAGAGPATTTPAAGTPPPAAAGAPASTSPASAPVTTPAATPPPTTPTVPH